MNQDLSSGAIDPADSGRSDQQRLMDMVSRELRTPVSGLMAVAEILSRQPLTLESQAYIRTIIETSKATCSSLRFSHWA